MNKIVAFINAFEHKTPLHKGLLFALLVALFIPHWLISYHAIQTTIGPDLLLRTIGSRLQQAGQPIYQYQWKPGDPIAWLNPYADTRVGLNGVVTTPVALRLLQPLANLSYCNIRIIWGCTQEIFLFATTWFCCITFQRRLSQLLFVIAAILFFIYDRNWQLNLYNGQMYVLYAFVFSLSGYIMSRHRNEKFVLALFPLISIIRPFFITAAIPFFKLRKSYLLWLVIGVATAILLVAISTTTNEWKQYNNAMKLYAKEQTGELSMNNNPPGLHSPYSDVCTVNQRKSFTVFGAGCLYSLQHYLYLCRVSISDVRVYQVILALFAAMAWWIAYQKKWFADIPKQFVLSFLFYQACELITPASRNPYNMIQWLPAVALLFAWGNKQTLWLLFIGLCLNHDVPFWFKYEREIGEMFLFAAAIIFLFKADEKIAKSTL